MENAYRIGSMPCGAWDGTRLQVHHICDNAPVRVPRLIVVPTRTVPQSLSEGHGWGRNTV
jgi:hypothetical protein